MSIAHESWEWILAGYATSLVGGLIAVGGFHCSLRFWMEDRKLWNCSFLRCFWFGVEDEKAGATKRTQFTFNADDESNRQRRSVKAVPAGLTGFVERLVFTTFTAVTPLGAPVAMGGWIALKLAANWRRDLPGENGRRPTRDDAQQRTRQGFAALLSNLLSMFVAWIGGAFVRLGLIIDLP